MCSVKQSMLLLIVVVSFDYVWTQCDHGWINHADSCYLVVEETETWYQAMIHCKGITYGGGLAEVETQQENDFLKAMLRKKTENIMNDRMYWIGGSDEAKENQWYWVRHDKPIDFTDWNPNQPDNSGQAENCLQMKKKYNFRWDDRPCMSRFPFICEQRTYDCHR